MATTPKPHPIIAHIIESHAAIAADMQRKIKQHRRNVRAAEARALNVPDVETLPHKQT
jgi:hypothetical protein